MVKRDSFLLVSSDFHFRSSSRSVTLDLLWCRCLTNLAPLRWTISILLMSTLSCGSQTQLANSTVGLTIDMYAVSLVLVDAIYIYNSVLTCRQHIINSSASVPPNATKIAVKKVSDVDVCMFGPEL